MDNASGLSRQDVIERAFAMPLNSPPYPPAPDKFLDRPALTVTYRSDLERIRQLVPEPLELRDPLVSIAFLYMVAPGLGDYYEISQSISAYLDGEAVSFRPSMYAGNVNAILDGREIWGLPKKFGSPMLALQTDTLVGTLDYSGSLVAKATMAYKHREMDFDRARQALTTPGVVLKIIPHVDGKPRILELVRIDYQDVVVKGAWTGPGTLELFPHARAPLAELPVREIVSVTHTICDTTLPYGRVVHDYLA
ncbi:acetoacetate decarboxylase [Burkholderia stagnalis]|uniref:acetoacetate decarboxylase n=1 Tax=Burkholderia stagnalis TaxID=1503054 RepID=UPI000A7F165E|nr:acetoacetate decarboxylase [Burkholderia stagnalis]